MVTDKDCLCPKCVKCCSNLPGIPKPNEISKQAKFLGLTITKYLKRYCIKAWRDGIFDIENNIEFVYPARVGYANTKESFAYPLDSGDCIFLKKGRCQIHPVKSFECRKSVACDENDSKNYRNIALKEWDKAWKNKTIHPEIVKFLKD